MSTPAHNLNNTLRRIFFCQFCHLPHQVNGGVLVFTDAQKLQHLLNNYGDILTVRDPEEQLQRLQENIKRSPVTSGATARIGDVEAQPTPLSASPHA